MYKGAQNFFERVVGKFGQDISPGQWLRFFEEPFLPDSFPDPLRAEKLHEGNVPLYDMKMDFSYSPPAPIGSNFDITAMDFFSPLSIPTKSSPQPTFPNIKLPRSKEQVDKGLGMVIKIPKGIFKQKTPPVTVFFT